MVATRFNLADLFEQSVDAWTDRDYIVFGDVRRTYGEMEARANQLAHHLAAEGWIPGTSPRMTSKKNGARRRRSNQNSFKSRPTTFLRSALVGFFSGVK